MSSYLIQTALKSSRRSIGNAVNTSYRATLLATRPVAIRSAQASAYPTQFQRHFSGSMPTLKKASKEKGKGKDHKGGSKAPAADEVEESVSLDEIVNIAELQQKMDATVDHFKERITVVRQGIYTPAIIENVVVKTAAHTEEPVKNIARVAMKGPRAITITAFDAADVKHIISAVIGANLNLNPQPDPKQEQVLRVPLPPTTSETKKEIIKNLKHEFEHFKNSPTKKSLTSIRGEAMKALKKVTISKTDLFTVKTKIEDAYKAKCNTLAEVLKQAEAATMKD
ncbi:uncharacterized protein SAPINGB_P002784 [Magnusiomyces paraingens]|uniref:Ribosome-recycling factor, mitochondrial n=1 Tax=Magnusiomyces paraingens TaxID=2606893 RepID=A0A5E8BG26_9ASCO|nr:uncharacterized protein SAPINGB_P002784 [Saprochaete ingens]VVT50500.1 unnamed protein product [Saprochaete ingens]